MQIVNGYICMNCCDVDKARMNEDPHQSTNQIQKVLDRHLDKLSPANFGSAVTLGGSLQTTTVGSAANPASTSQTAQVENGPVLLPAVNLLV
jgi:hypothetical protein